MFLIFINFLLLIVDLFLLISILKTTDNNTDLILDIEKSLQRLERKRSCGK